MSTISTLTDDQKKRIEDVIDAGETSLERIEQERLALKDLAQSLADSLQIKPAEVMKAINLSFKQRQKDAIGEEQDKQNNIEQLLHAAGRI